MSRYKCWCCRSEHSTENMEAVCVQCFSRLKNELVSARDSLAEANELLEKLHKVLVPRVNP